MVGPARSERLRWPLVAAVLALAVVTLLASAVVTTLRGSGDDPSEAAADGPGAEVEHDTDGAGADDDAGADGAEDGDGAGGADGAGYGDGAEDGGGTAGATGGTSSPDDRSAVRGPEGTRTFAAVPEEFPEGLVPADARAVEGTVARGGDDWSAVVVFRTERDRGSLEQAIDTAAEAEGFRRRDAVEDDERRVIRYDGSDGAVLTVTLRDEGEELVVGAALVSG